MLHVDPLEYSSLPHFLLFRWTFDPSESFSGGRYHDDGRKEYRRPGEDGGGWPGAPEQRLRHHRLAVIVDPRVSLCRAMRRR